MIIVVPIAGVFIFFCKPHKLIIYILRGIEGIEIHTLLVDTYKWTHRWNSDLGYAWNLYI